MSRHPRSWVLVAVLGVVGCGGTEPSETGRLEVSFSATGAELPSHVRLDIDGKGHNLERDSVTEYILAVGAHTVRFHASTNCLTDGAPSATSVVSVTRDSAVRLSFSLTCVSSLAQVTIALARAGSDPTPYLLTAGLDHVSRPVTLTKLLLAGSPAVFNHVSPGTMHADLGQVPDNCSVAEGNQQTVPVAMGDTLTVVFTLTCSSPSGWGLAAGTHLMHADGGGVAWLGSGGSADWAPDGTRLAFIADDTIWTVAPDGTGRMSSGPRPGALWTPGLGSFMPPPMWSPDGTRLALIDAGPLGPTIYVMRADGTGLVALVGDASAKSGLRWSPDGQTLAYSGGGELYLLAADGSSVRSLTTGRYPVASPPSWSPDGSRLAFQRSMAGVHDILVIDTAGTNVTLLTPGAENGWSPDWSPAGDRVAYLSSPDSGYRLGKVATVGADGAGRLILPMYGVGPRWAPDGARIGFASQPLGGCDFGCRLSAWRPSVVNPDGSGLRMFTTGLWPVDHLSWGRLP